jgi:uncharacterized cupin superfamily protein
MNVYDEAFDVDRERHGVKERLRNVGHALGTDLLGATVFDVEPGYVGPYHLHHGNEELVLVIDGTPTVRTATGERELARGDIAFFPRGADGLHAIENRSNQPTRFVVFSSKVHPDITERPEERLIGVFAGDVPTAGRDAPFEAFFPRDAAVD